jgi:hypothetical protein
MAAEPQQPGRLPDFFIIGHHKSGTTALYEMLRRHPQVFMPELKEPRWFARDLRGPFESPNSNLPQTLEEYLALFAPAGPGQTAGEASPSYLRSRLAAGEIAELVPAARCIAILREPAAFVRSLHLQLVQEHVESERDLRRAVQGERLERDGHTILRYSDHIHYVEQLERYRRHFPAEQLLVLIYDDFRADNEVTVRGVLRFLEVDDTLPVAELDANPSVSLRMTGMDRAVATLQRRNGALKRGARALVPEPVRRRAIGGFRRRVIYGRAEPVDERVTAELRARYAGEVRALSEYLGRDLVSLWGYDGLA